MVDEIVIADTGSTDGTPEIAREFGARVIEIPWQNDFAAARNRALAGMRSEWVLSLDADEMLDPAAEAEISKLTSWPSRRHIRSQSATICCSLEDRIWDRPAQPNDFRLPEARHILPMWTTRTCVCSEAIRGIYFVGPRA